MSLDPSLHKLFSPSSIAIKGDSFLPGMPGYTIIKNLQDSGFTGPVIPISSDSENILGLPTFCKITNIPTEKLPIDLVILCVPTSEVPECLEAMAQIGANIALVVACGPKNIWDEESKLDVDVKSLANKLGITMIGPNSMGVAFPHANLNLFAVPKEFKKGVIGFFSQSASMCDGMSAWAERNGFGFSSFISLGNKTIFDEADAITAMADDPQTKVILGFLESIEHGEKFLKASQNATRKKPVILMKIARTDIGARASGAHIGATTGTDMAYDAAFKQAGIIRASRTEDLFTLAQAFSSQPLPTGPGVGLVTMANGPGIVTADACASFGLSMSIFSPSTFEALNNVLPGHSFLFNPVNISGDISESVLMDALKVVIKDPAVHSLLFIGAKTCKVPLKKTAELLANEGALLKKPVFACIIGGEEANDVRSTFCESGIACYEFPETVVKAASSMLRQSLWKDSPLPVKVGYRRNMAKARTIIDNALNEGITKLAEYKAMELAKAYEMPILEAKLARSSAEAVTAAKHIHYPVALKIASPHIIHKSEAQGIALDITSPDMLRKEFSGITERVMKYQKNAYIAGCIVQAMAPKNSHEVVIGFQRDAHFGPMVLFSLAGIYRETFRDIACRLAPLSLSDAHDMIREIKFFPLLAGNGCTPKLTVLEDLLLIMSELSMDFPQIQEAFCDPVFINEHGAYLGGMHIFLNRK